MLSRFGENAAFSETFISLFYGKSCKFMKSLAAESNEAYELLKPLCRACVSEVMIGLFMLDSKLLRLRLWTFKLPASRMSVRPSIKLIFFKMRPSKHIKLSPSLRPSDCAQ